MPQLFKFGKYIIYLWSDEGFPVEPVHVHVSKGRPSREATKVWITKSQKALVCHNKSRIPKHELNLICRFLEANSDLIITAWKDHFSELSYYC